MVPCTPNPARGEVIQADPAIEVHEDVLYRPVRGAALDEDREWGIYTSDGALVDAAAYYRGPGKTLVGQSFHLPPMARAEAAPMETCVYGGLLIPHYGHFVLSSIARCWPLADAGLGGHPVLCHLAPGLAGPDLPYMQDVFGALGLSRDCFVSFEAPTRIKRLIVPRPSLEEQSFVHAAYTRLTHRIGARLLGKAAPARGGPVFLSRTKLPVATQGFENEQAVEDILASFGVEIAHPETLPMADQVRLFAERRVVAGAISSAFHTAVFCREPGSMICLSPSPMVNPNFDMLDRVNAQDARYYRVASKHLGIEMTRRIWSMFRIDEPMGVARQVLAMMQAASLVQRSDGTP